jgi:hypothetical protein
VLRREKIA